MVVVVVLLHLLLVVLLALPQKQHDLIWTVKHTFVVVDDVVSTAECVS